MSHDLRQDNNHHGSALPHMIDPTAGHHAASADPSFAVNDPRGPHQIHVEGEPAISMHSDNQSKPKVPFKAKVEGYAKKFAGKTFGKEHEVAAGEARLRGEDLPKNV